MMRYESALVYLYSFHNSDEVRIPENHKAKRALELLGVTNTQVSKKIIHITGTNGKGSTAAYCEVFLLSVGCETVVLTSPHINSVRERIRLNGSPISRDLFIQLLSSASPVLERLRRTIYHPSVMTIITILALLLNERMGLRCFGIYEVGVGGKNDSTNLFENAIIGLTRVSDDHVDRFGGSVESLLYEKLGLCHQASTLIYQRQDLELTDIIRRYCISKSINSAQISDTTGRDIEKYIKGEILIGDWQIENASLSYELFKNIEPTSPGVKSLSKRIMGRRPYNPGRLQLRTIENRDVLLDGAHNISAIKCLLSYIGHDFDGAKNIVAIIGFSESKRWREMLRLIVESCLFSSVIFTRSTRPRGVDPLEIAGLASSITTTPVHTATSLRTALNWVLENTGGTILVSGSLLLVGDFDRALHALGHSEIAVPLEDIDPQQSWMHAL